jgi:hypothetical protein
MLNETAKIPASYSLVPASNHYELQSFDETAPHAALARSFLHVCMRDSSDDARIAHRMEIMSQVLREQNGRAESITVEGSSRAEQLVRAWLTAYFTAQAVARSHQIDPDSAPLTESFKKRL